MKPDISVVIPARNEGSRIGPTIHAIAEARATKARLEFIVVDDASTDACIANLISAVPHLLHQPNIDIRVLRLDDHSGIYKARNGGASAATGDVLFMTDAHVRFSPGWDQLVLENLRSNRVLSGITTQEGADFRGYGCHLLIPFMGTCWNQESSGDGAPVEIAPCHATALSRELFIRLGGYDSGMIFCGGGEPEFSLRAWLHGAEVTLLENLQVEHHFKSEDEINGFLTAIRPYAVHNRIRFGLLYLSELGCLQLLRYYARAYSGLFQSVMRTIAASDVWERRAFLEQNRERSFDWFVDYFGLTNQVGDKII